MNVLTKHTAVMFMLSVTIPLDRTSARVRARAFMEMEHTAQVNTSSL